MILFRLRGWGADTPIPLQMANESFKLSPELIGPPSMDALQVRHHGPDVDGVKTAVCAHLHYGVLTCVRFYYCPL